MKLLRLGLPTGSLEKATLELFQKSGWRIKVSSRNYFPSIDDPEMRCTLVRAQEMSRYVESGVFDVGITGKDWVLENESQVEAVQELVYSKTSFRSARWVLAVPAAAPIKSINDLEGKTIATELVNYTRKYFSSRGIKVHVEFSWGATEAKVAEGLVDAIVDVTETGSTIKANNLRIVDELLVSNPQLIANRAAWQDPWKKEKIMQISTLLGGALKAENLVGLKMNVAAAHLDKIVDLLPSITAPTVSPLYHKDWFSIEIVISEEKVRELIPQLLKNGAEGIIEYALNKVV